MLHQIFMFSNKVKLAKITKPPFPNLPPVLHHFPLLLDERTDQ